MLEDRHCAYWRERRRRSDWSLDYWRDTMIALIAGPIAWAMTDYRELWGNVGVPLAAALASIAIYETGRFASFWPPHYTAEYDLRWLVEDGRIVGLRFLGRDSVPFVGRYRTGE